jgi:hypothetical protein
MHIRSRSRNRARGGGGGAGSALSTLASYGATDAFDFVADQYIRAGTVGPSGISVTRASDGYAQRENGIWQLFGSGVLRRTDKGLLVEGARTNRALHSRDLTQAAWTKTSVTVARNQVGIDGAANSACSLTATAPNGTVLQAVTSASTARYFSVWIKRITGAGVVEVTLDNGSTWTAVTITSAYTRVGATQTLANPTFGVRLVTDTDAVAVDFAQLEDGAFPTSPIATAGSSATRAADVVTAAPTSGTDYPLSLYAEFNRTASTGGTEAIFTLDSGSGNDEGFLYVSNGEIFSLFIETGSSLQATPQVSGVVPLFAPQKGAGRIEANNFQAARNGAISSVGTSGTSPGIPSRILFGQRHIASQLNGYVRRAAIIPSSLSQTNLEEITT